jgi:hypothetical protein
MERLNIWQIIKLDPFCLLARLCIRLFDAHKGLDYQEKNSESAFFHPLHLHSPAPAPGASVRRSAAQMQVFLLLVLSAIIFLRGVFKVNLANISRSEKPGTRAHE